MNGPEWQKASYSGANSDCVEVRAIDGMVELRESDEGDVILRTTPQRLANLLRRAKAGELTAQRIVPVAPCLHARGHRQNNDLRRIPLRGHVAVRRAAGRGPCGPCRSRGGSAGR
ncbi:DUF397 domain-containing protein [Kitasatospora sp. NPDC093558]|uniref:DUF397 domain-containing protein n=1 Tax=Kitasatospora sp. NPDC093558 TaxID=3155201 RepID=UPI003430B4EC